MTLRASTALRPVLVRRRLALRAIALAPVAACAAPFTRRVDDSVPAVSSRRVADGAPGTFLLLHGTYRLRGNQPDGDSVKFHPDDVADWSRLPGPAVRANTAGGAQVRLNGIDALETHYTPPVKHAKRVAQPPDLARAAAAELVAFLGFTRVERDESQRVTHAEPERSRGHILASPVDRYGRVIAFAFRGDHAAASGSLVALDAAKLAASANQHLLAAGLAYPTFYSKLSHENRRQMAEAARQSRASRRGLWAKDLTETGFRLTSAEGLETSAYILPKLFRRVADCLAEGAGSSPQDFVSYLRGRHERVWIPSEQRSTSLADLVEARAGLLRLTRHPEDLVFDER